jgi:hypothetical protein
MSTVHSFRRGRAPGNGLNNSRKLLQIVLVTADVIPRSMFLTLKGSGSV